VDPRRMLAQFLGTGDDRGPKGMLDQQGWIPRGAATKWFAVFRPTSVDAITYMINGRGTGKGLNIKGKSAKQGVLSGFVPFLQISDNKHKKLIEASPSYSRVKIYYKTKAAREEAEKFLAAVLSDAKLEIDDRSILHLDDYRPNVFGLELPEPLMREAYIMRQDISPVMGWETGRRSEPAFMDMNLHAIRDDSEPTVVLFQNDESEPMNPRALLVAYAEKFVKPVVSDFDTFTVGSKGMRYDQLSLEQAKLVLWSLEHTQNILCNLDHNPWTSRWIEVLRSENEKGFHPTLPKYGFGDPTSYRLTDDVVAETAPCGAVRHGAECCNFYFPQELDDEYLVIWHEFPNKPWDYLNEKSLRMFLLDRLKEGFSFPINPVWPVRDKGWFEVFTAMHDNKASWGCIQAWYPPQVAIVEKIHEMHKEHPDGFKIVDSGDISFHG